MKVKCYNGEASSFRCWTLMVSSLGIANNNEVRSKSSIEKLGVNPKY